MTLGSHPLRKGDVAVHEFHGNQYKDADAAADAATKRANGLGYSDKGGEAAHRQAAAAHDKAKGLATNNVLAGEHARMAAQHRRDAERHAAARKG